MSAGRIKSIAVIGAGTMGQGIAQVCALSGFQVFLYDVQDGLAGNAIASIRHNLDFLSRKGKITQAQGDQAAAGLQAANDLDQVRSDMVIEAVIEKLEVKREIFAALERSNPEDCVLTTNTSSISVAQIASALKNPGRFAGLHFFNPAPVMKLVEVVKGPATTDSTIDTLFAVTRQLGKEAVLTQDSPGFIVNRVARHYYVEALRLLEENAADHQTIDALLRATGFKMGPFELMDLIGVDVNFSVTLSMYNAFNHAPRFRPSRIQQEKVNAGHHGRKSGRGFYDYK